MATKLSQKEQAEVRGNLYKVALGAIQALGNETEVVSEGAIIHLPDGQYARLKITYCNPEKFSLEVEREEYRDKLARAAERQEKAAAKAKEKAEKAAARAAKAQSNAD